MEWKDIEFDDTRIADLRRSGLGHIFSRSERRIQDQRRHLIKMVKALANGPAAPWLECPDYYNEGFDDCETACGVSNSDVSDCWIRWANEQAKK